MKQRNSVSKFFKLCVLRLQPRAENSPDNYKTSVFHSLTETHSQSPCLTKQMPSSADSLLKYNDHLPKVRSTHAVHLSLFKCLRRHVLNPSQLLRHGKFSHKSVAMRRLTGLSLRFDIYRDSMVGNRNTYSMY